jgi:CheY-like chemotaxis protein
VDDDPDILSAAQSLLRALGSSVTIARTRIEVSAQIESGAYDVLMTDVTMPDFSGWDLARKSKSKYPAKAVVLVTGWGAALDPEKSQAGLVDAVLAKPFTLDELEKALAGLAR